MRDLMKQPREQSTWIPGVWAREVALPDTIKPGQRVYARALLHTLASWMSSSDDRVRAHNMKEIADAADQRTRGANELLNALADGGVLVKHKTKIGHTVEWSPVRNAPTRLRRLSTCGDSAPVETQQVAPAESQQVEPAVLEQVEPAETQQPLVPSVAPDVPTGALSSLSFDDMAFEAFWGAAERTGPKKVARECYDKALARGATHEQLLDAMLKWVAYWNTPGAATRKWPQGWLNQDYWQGEPPTIARDKPRRTGGSERTLSALDRLKARASDATLPALPSPSTKEIER